MSTTWLMPRRVESLYDLPRTPAPIADAVSALLAPNFELMTTLAFVAAATTPGSRRPLAIPAEVVFRRDLGPSAGGLRSRKKARTRVAIEDAALALFEERGYDATSVEEIAARAEVSQTTFFRYYPTKAEVLLSDHGEQLPALHQAIVDRPPAESDLVAVQRAVQQEWVAAIDATRTARKAQVVAANPVLQGLSFQRGVRWLEVIADALARRRGLAASDERCGLVARVALGVLASAFGGWIAGGCRGDLDAAVEHAFGEMAELCRQWCEEEASGGRP